MSAEDFIIPKKHKDSLVLLALGLATGNIDIMQCTERKTGNKVWCLMVQKSKGDGTFDTAPIAKLFEGDSCVEMRPPDEIAEGGGFGHN